MTETKNLLGKVPRNSATVDLSKCGDSYPPAPPPKGTKQNKQKTPKFSMMKTWVQLLRMFLSFPENYSNTEIFCSIGMENLKYSLTVLLDEWKECVKKDVMFSLSRA